MQGHFFVHDLRVLQMGGSDMVLGVDWMKKYSPLIFDFNEMTLSFTKEGKQIKLKGGSTTSTLKIILGEKLQKLAGKEADLMGEFYMFISEGVDSSIPVELRVLLDAYADVFEEPTRLPPERSHDHSIFLITTC